MEASDQAPANGKPKEKKEVQTRDYIFFTKHKVLLEDIDPNPVDILVKRGTANASTVNKAASMAGNDGGLEGIFEVAAASSIVTKNIAVQTKRSVSIT